MALSRTFQFSRSDNFACSRGNRMGNNESLYVMESLSSAEAEHFLRFQSAPSSSSSLHNRNSHDENDQMLRQWDHLQRQCNDDNNYDYQSSTSDSSSSAAAGAACLETWNRGLISSGRSGTSSSSSSHAISMMSISE